MPEHAGLVAASCLIAFLLGSIPFGLIVSRLADGGDLRQQGSGNIGATNVSRILGFWPWGLLTFVLDLIKGALPVFLLGSGRAQWLVANLLYEGAHWEVTRMDEWAVALACVLGHCFSPWLRFKGGKGVATGFGAILVLSPLTALVGAAAFGLAFAATRTGSLSSLTGILAAAATHLVYEPLGPHLWIGAALILVILIRHETNLDALLQNREKTLR